MKIALFLLFLSTQQLIANAQLCRQQQQRDIENLVRHVNIVSNTSSHDVTQSELPLSMKPDKTSDQERVEFIEHQKLNIIKWCHFTVTQHMIEMSELDTVHSFQCATSDLCCDNKQQAELHQLASNDVRLVVSSLVSNVNQAVQLQQSKLHGGLTAILHESNIKFELEVSNRLPLASSHVSSAMSDLTALLHSFIVDGKSQGVDVTSNDYTRELISVVQRSVETFYSRLVADTFLCEVAAVGQCDTPEIRFYSTCLQLEHIALYPFLNTNYVQQLSREIASFVDTLHVLHAALGELSTNTEMMLDNIENDDVLEECFEEWTNQVYCSICVPAESFKPSTVSQCPCQCTSTLRSCISSGLGMSPETMTSWTSTMTQLTRWIERVDYSTRRGEHRLRSLGKSAVDYIIDVLESDTYDQMAEVMTEHCGTFPPTTPQRLFDSSNFGVRYNMAQRPYTTVYPFWAVSIKPSLETFVGTYKHYWQHAPDALCREEKISPSSTCWNGESVISLNSPNATLHCRSPDVSPQTYSTLPYTFTQITLLLTPIDTRIGQQRRRDTKRLPLVAHGLDMSGGQPSVVRRLPSVSKEALEYLKNHDDEDVVEEGSGGEAGEVESTVQYPIELRTQPLWASRETPKTRTASASAVYGSAQIIIILLVMALTNQR